MEYHSLSPADLSALASGFGGAPVVRELVASQLSRHLLLLRFLRDSWPIDRRFFDAAVTTLAETQRRSPELFADLMGGPLVGAWLAKITRVLRAAPEERITRPGDLLHLGALAASGALTLGLAGTMTGYARGGRLTLPGLGDAILPGAGDEPVQIDVRAGRATLTWSSGTSVVPGDGESWHGLRRLSGRDRRFTCTVAIEDGNPYRAGYHAPPTDRLDCAEVAVWQHLFADAWELICGHLPERAAELAVGLRAVVPLAGDGSAIAASGTSRDSVGALGLTRPRSAADFAVTLVHEFQHSKLSALLDMMPMYGTADQERHFAPWRDDPRPTAGLIQGVYAFLGVADTWRGLRASPDLTTQATAEFAFAREQVRVGLDSLEGSTELTADGRHFVAGMRVALNGLLAESLPAAALQQARSSIDRRRVAWTARNPAPVGRVR